MPEQLVNWVHYDPPLQSVPEMPPFIQMRGLREIISNIPYNPILFFFFNSEMKSRCGGGRCFQMPQREIPFLQALNARVKGQLPY